MEQNMSPDEKITIDAIGSFDPFSRPSDQTIQQSNTEKTTMKNRRKKVKRVVEKSAKVAEEEAIAVEEPAKVLDSMELPTKEEIKEKVHDNVTLQSPIVESRSSEGLPSYRTEFAGRDIFVGFSSSKATNPITALALISIALDFGRDKIRFDVSTDENNFYKSRNELAQKFLETDAKWLLLLDNNVIPSIGRPAWAKANIGAARHFHDSHLQKHIVHRLIGAGKTLVGGACFLGQDSTTIDCSNKNLGVKAKSCSDGVTQVDWIGSGCLLIHRKVFMDIKTRYPDLNQGPFYPDDISFCKRAKECGHDAYIDLGIPVFNVGIKAF
jgi:hypothetical protein